MKTPPIIALLSLAALIPIPAVLPAAETVKFETVLYLFKSRSIARIDYRQALHGQIPLAGDGIVVTPPATIGFDEEKLVLHGAGYAWNGGQVVPSRFSETKMPTIIATAGQPATIRIAVPVQFLEMMPDGSLQVREIPRDSPDAPRYQLKLTALPAAEAPRGYDLKVTCQMDISTMQGRKKIPGVNLEVGPPITARFNKSVEFWGRTDEWFGIMAGQQESGDYTLCMLLKVSLVAPVAK